MKAKRYLHCYINRDGGHAPQAVLHISNHFGIMLERAAGSDGQRYLCAVIWYPRGRKRLGYFYPSIRYF